MDLTALARRREVVLLVLIALLLAAVGARAPVFLTPASLGDVLTNCLEHGFALGKKAGDREKLARITRADLIKAKKGVEA